MKEYQLQAKRDGEKWVNLGRGEDFERLKFNSGIYQDVAINTPFIGVLGDTYRIVETGCRLSLEDEGEKVKKMPIENISVNNYYESWAEAELRNAIWQLANGMSIKGPYADIDLLRAELRRRGLTEDGYHNT